MQVYLFGLYLIKFIFELSLSLMITTEDLRFIRTVASNPTLIETARTLNVTPPSVTLRLQSLEKKLNCKIIHRPSRKTRLTEEGRLILEKGISILNSMDELEETLREHQYLFVGKLKVLAPLGFGNDHVAPTLAQFQNIHPKLNIELTLSDNPHWSSYADWDLIIYIGALNDLSLKMITLAKNKRFLCASPKYIEQYGKPHTPEDLIYHHCIALRENNEDVTWWPFQHWESGKPSGVRVTPSMSSNEGRVVKSWAVQGLGIIMRSEWDVKPQLETGELVQLLPDYVLPDADIVLLVDQQKQQRSARVNGYIDFLKSHLLASGMN